MVLPLLVRTNYPWQKSDGWEVDKSTGKRKAFWSRTEFTPHSPCYRANCSWCLVRNKDDNPERYSVVDNRLREITIDGLKRLRKLAEMSFYSLMAATTLPINYDDYNYESASLVEEE
jgi:hypothetical protein